MRNLFFLILAANIFIFMFFYYLPDNSQKSQVTIPSGTKQLVLLSEIDKASLTLEDAESVESKPEVMAAKDLPVEIKCFTIGPFREEKEIINFESQIKSKVKKTGIRERVEKLHWRYWVYLPAAGSKEKAVDRASDLAKKGLKDYYVIARGEFKNSISLGHFKEKEWAEKRLQSIKKMGYSPEMSAIEKEYTLYWLDYVAKNGRGLSNLTLNSLELEESIHQFNRECQK